MTSSPVDQVEDGEELLTCIPKLAPQLQQLYSGPHTQYVSSCLFANAEGTYECATLVVSCTQMFLCDAKALVLRVALFDRLVAVYERKAAASTEELLLVMDQEHDMLLQGTFVCDGSPRKPLLPLLRCLHAAHHVDVPLSLHLDYPTPLREIARLKIPALYVAPLPQPEEDFARCPCWRDADVLQISDEEFRRRVYNLLIVHAPDKLSKINELCTKYKRRKGGALQFLIQKYGPEPTQEHAQAVSALHEKEKKFCELVGEGAAAVDARSLSTVMGVSRHQQIRRPSVYMSTLYLLKQPSGGWPPVRIRVTPLSAAQGSASASGFSAFKRTDGVDPNTQFFYLTNEGYVLPFDITPQALLPFGFCSGDRVLSTWGVTSGRWTTVVGVRDGLLWVHDDGERGAAALVGFHSRQELEKINGWTLGDHSRLDEASAMLFRSKEDGGMHLFNITPEACGHFGFYHGEVVCSAVPCADPSAGSLVVSGVKDGLLYVCPVGDACDPSQAGEQRNEGPPLRNVVVSSVAGCRHQADIIAQHGWKVVGARCICGECLLDFQAKSLSL